jgi:hypothetical protein
MAAESETADRPMEELVAGIAARSRVDPAVARQAAIIILAFLRREGPAAAVQRLIDALPGAGDLVGKNPSSGRGIMGVFNELTAAGLGMADIQGVARAFGAVAKAKVGATIVDEVVGAIPGLGQFM